MSIKKTTATLQQALLLEHEDLFWILCHACGGVMLQTQFLKWISRTAHGTSTAMRLKNLLVEVGLIKTQKIIKNIILIPTSAMLRKKTSIHRVNVGTRKIFYSAYVMNLLLEKDLHNPTQARKFLEGTTLPHYFMPAGFGILCTLEQYEQQIATQCPDWDVTGIKNEKQRMAIRAQVQQAQLIGEKVKLELDTTQPDLYNLERLDIHLAGIYFTADNGKTTLHIKALYLDCCNRDKRYKSEDIVTAINTIEAVFQSFQTNHHVMVHLEVYSHAKENLHHQNAVINAATAHMANQNRFENLSQNVHFTWLDSSNSLFSHVDVYSLI